MITEVLIILALLFVKHWYVDFVNQSMDEVASKGNYGEWLGIRHSLKQGLGTFLVFFLTDLSLVMCVILALIDFAIHYHTDWAKININRKKHYTVETPEFWMWLGVDQLIHSFTYLFLIWIVV